MPSSPSQPIDLSWGDFESRGFSDDFDSDGFSLFSEVGRPSIDSEAVSHRPQKLKKPYPYAALASRHLELGRRYRPDQGDEGDAASLAYEIKDLRATKVDPFFIELYLDSLEDPSVTSHWPTFVIADLKDIGSLYRAVIVELGQPEASKASETTAPAQASGLTDGRPEISQRPSKRQKTGFFSLGSRRKLLSTTRLDSHRQETTKPPATTSSGHPGLGINELGQLQQVTAADEFLLPDQSRRQSVPTIVKTSPLTPPRRHSSLVRSASSRPKPIPEHESERRTSPSPSQSSGSLGKKISRKPVPDIEDENVVLSEVSDEAMQATLQTDNQDDQDQNQSPTQEPQVQAEHAEPTAQVGLTPSEKTSATVEEVAEARQMDPEGASSPTQTDEMAAQGNKVADFTPVEIHNLTPAVTVDNVLPGKGEDDKLDTTKKSSEALPESEDILEAPVAVEAAPGDFSDDQVADKSLEATESVIATGISHVADEESTRPRTPSSESQTDQVDIPTVIIEDADAVDDHRADSIAVTANVPHAAILPELSSTEGSVSEESSHEESVNETGQTANEVDAEPQDLVKVQDTTVPDVTEERSNEPTKAVAEESEDAASHSDHGAKTDALPSAMQEHAQDDLLKHPDASGLPLTNDLSLLASDPTILSQEEQAPAEASVAAADSPTHTPVAVRSVVEEMPVLSSDDEVKQEVQHSTPKRFGSTLNRVSPSLKERFGSGNKSQTTTPEKDVPKEKAVRAQAPPSPSRRAALLSGAMKMLTRKKSAPSGSLSVTRSSASDAPDTPDMPAIPAPVSTSVIRDARIDCAVSHITPAVKADGLPHDSNEGPFLTDEEPLALASDSNSQSMVEATTIPPLVLAADITEAEQQVPDTPPTSSAPQPATIPEATSVAKEGDGVSKHENLDSVSLPLTELAAVQETLPLSEPETIETSTAQTQASHLDHFERPSASVADGHTRDVVDCAQNAGDCDLAVKSEGKKPTYYSS